jgi:hypothetical protein
MSLEGCKRSFWQAFACFWTLSLAQKPLDGRDLGRSQQEGPGTEWHYIRPTLKRSLGQMRAEMGNFRNMPGDSGVIYSNDPGFVFPKQGNGSFEFWKRFASNKLRKSKIGIYLCSETN